ncbi:OLC1v1001674C1 [Oldenlandia corymbosa var. corymbosa]|uniref:OLC1v1001674C1 n=1 Tax=Oldenlandia corymbosa var. corymbosa TaxID=529605 RepID=A0AAV1D5R6_OLDCO|nr:OLC1v1001674C1 [Oldenlandia corymbosa var. corymbosa]
MEFPEIKPTKLSHFSHRHPLELLEVEEKDALLCSGCELQLQGAAYNCTKPSCDFILHDSCTDLPRQLKHNSHPKHRLILQFHPPYRGEFTCNACGDVGHGFSYHCSTCNFDLHVECASLPEVENREDHEHPFVLLYSSSFPATKDDGKGKKAAEMQSLFNCYVCDGPVENGRWMYRCSGCPRGAHLDCVSS